MKILIVAALAGSFVIGFAVCGAMRDARIRKLFNNPEAMGLGYVLSTLSAEAKKRKETSE